jgi:hypothetical protein
MMAMAAAVDDVLLIRTTCVAHPRMQFPVNNQFYNADNIQNEISDGTSNERAIQETALRWGVRGGKKWRSLSAVPLSSCWLSSSNNEIDEIKERMSGSS